MGHRDTAHPILMHSTAHLPHDEHTSSSSSSGSESEKALILKGRAGLGVGKVRLTAGLGLRLGLIVQRGSGMKGCSKGGRMAGI